MPEQLKNRMLTIFKFLWTQTDEDHPTTIRHIQEHLMEAGIEAGRKTVADDILALREVGYDVICNKRQQNQYFIGQRDFELPELMLLIDAVQASQFITNGKKTQLIKKLSTQASCHQAKELTHRIKATTVNGNTPQSLYYMMDWLRTVIAKRRRVRFQYFAYDSQKEQVLKHDGQVYEVSPYDLMWSGDRYYLIGYSENHDKVVTFRVDRILNLEPGKKMARPYPEDYQPQVYRNQVFQMFQGETRVVTLRCDNSMMNAVIDRFGLDCRTHTENETHFLLDVIVSASPTFYAWVFTFGDHMEILAPESVVDGYHQRLRQALQ